jgi:hypothetical protein
LRFAYGADHRRNQEDKAESRSRHARHAGLRPRHVWYFGVNIFLWGCMV